MSPLRILRIVHRLYPPKVGGLSLHAHDISRRQAMKGHKVVVMTTLEGDYPRHEWRDGYEIRRFHALASPLENPITLRMLPQLFSQFSRERFDVIHAHSHLLATTNMAALARYFRRVPFVVTNHGFIVARGATLDVLQRAYLHTMGSLTVRVANAVISFTKLEQHRMTSLGVDPRKAVVIPNGVDTTFFSPRKCVRDSNMILWTGRFVKEKGLTYLLQAMKQIVQNRKSAKLGLIGYGPLEQSLRRLRVKLGLEENVVFLGVRAPAEIADLLNQCAVFVHPSLSEGFPSSVLEAMSCERPVVVTKGIGMESIVGDVGLYSDLADPESIAENVLKILNDSCLGDDLGRRACRRVRAEYDWSRVIDATDQLYSKIVS